MKRRNRNSQIVTIMLLLVVVVALSIGFAVFSNTLVVKPSATVKPNESTFNVDFSTNSQSVVAGSVTPTLSSQEITANSAVIDNSTNPTITGFKVDFTEKGQSAVYKFYAYNKGEYVAYLKNIKFLNVSGEDSHKVCTAIYGTSQTVAEAACDSIKMTVQIGNLTVNETTTNISGKSISKGASHEIIITVEYLSGGSDVTGDFTTKFGSIELEYSTV